MTSTGLAGSMARLVAIEAVPGLPGATTSSLVAGAEARQRAKACSRAPAPRSKIFTPQPYRDVPLHALSAVLHVSCSDLTEISRLPRRDRSISGSRSVRFRTEIGSVAGRNWATASPPQHHRQPHPIVHAILSPAELRSSRKASSDSSPVTNATFLFTH